MPNGRKFTWEEMKEAEARALKKGEFQGMVLEALQDLKGDVKDLQNYNNNTRYVSMIIAGVSGIVSGIFGGNIRQ